MLVFKLEKLMQERGLTEKDIIAGGINRNTLRALLSARNTRIDHATLEKLCLILDCSPGDLYGLEQAQK